jgi:DNA-binding NtrC family response regulator
VLAEFFLRKYSEQYNKASLQLKKKALSHLMQHGWPGNIRELEHTIEKGVILSGDREIGPEHLFPASSSMKASPTIDTFDLGANEKIIIEKVLRSESGNIASSARKLGINRSTLYQKMKKYGL